MSTSATETRTPGVRLNERQRRFIAEYVVDLNATQAAIRAGYSQKTAGQIGHELLKKPEIAAAIDQRNQQIIEKAAGSAEWIVEQAVEVVRAGLAEPNLAAVNGALSLLAKRHPEFSGKSGEPERHEHLHLHAGVEESRQLLARIERMQGEGE